MFTGIVQGQAKLMTISGDQQLCHFKFKFPRDALEQIETGASIAINGTCLTVVGFNLAQESAEFDAIAETLKLTNLGMLEVGDCVNFERAARIGDEIGGHLMSGHIHSRIEIVNIDQSRHNCIFTFAMPASIERFIFSKGYIGLDGCSLTIAKVSDHTFTVHLIPETLRVTIFDRLKVGDLVNLEIDSQTQAIVETIDHYMLQKKEH